MHVYIHQIAVNNLLGNFKWTTGSRTGLTSSESVFYALYWGEHEEMWGKRGSHSILVHGLLCLPAWRNAR